MIIISALIGNVPAVESLENILVTTEGEPARYRVKREKKIVGNF